MGKENMIKKSNLILGIFVLTVVLVQGIVLVQAVGETIVCAEKTLEGAWCDNVPIEEADQTFRISPTSCESTNYCKLGTCINTQEGECQPNTPRNVCEQNQGLWDERDFDEIPQCQLGCCILGDEAAFTTQTSCKSLSSDSGLETNFRSDIRDEIRCIASANPRVEGACVFEEDFQTTCNLITKSECQTLEATKPEGNVEFHEGLLCSAETLATNCGPSEKTTCVANEDEVRFLDTCGNLANIYDSSKVNDIEYWTNIKERGESCNPGSSNANSQSCGNCNYFLGSTCRAFERGETARPNFGDNICKDLGCEWQEEEYQHGETWCQTSTETRKGENLPGTEHFRLVCYNNEVTIEQCAAFRNEVCLEDSIGDFSVASCNANLWWDCVLIDNEADCSDIEVRDCQWIEGQTNAFFTDDEGVRYVVNEDGELVEQEEDETREGASCVPKYTPGFDFWTEAGVDETLSAEEWCPFAQDQVVVTFEKGLVTSWGCKDNCEYVDYNDGDDPREAKVNEKWENEKNNLCVAFGDCGSSVNYQGIEGYNDGKATEINSPPAQDS